MFNVQTMLNVQTILNVQTMFNVQNMLNVQDGATIVFDWRPECREIEAHCQTLLIALCSVLKHILHIVPYTIGHSTAMNRIHI